MQGFLELEQHHTRGIRLAGGETADSSGGTTQLIATDDIRKDAERVKIRRFLYEKITRNGDYEDN